MHVESTCLTTILEGGPKDILRPNKMHACPKFEVNPVATIVDQ